MGRYPILVRDTRDAPTELRAPFSLRYQVSSFSVSGFFRYKTSPSRTPSIPLRFNVDLIKNSEAKRVAKKVLEECFREHLEHQVYIGHALRRKNSQFVLFFSELLRE